MLICSFLVTSALFSLFIALKISEGDKRLNKRFNDFIKLAPVSDIPISKPKKVKGSFLIPKLKELLRDRLDGKLSSAKESAIEKKLMEAGNPMGMSVLDYQLVELLSKIIAPAIFIMYGLLLGFNFGIIFFLGLFGLVFGMRLPSYFLNVKTKYRRKKALRELPDFLDLLTICLEAGLGFDSALVKVIECRHGILCDEFKLYLDSNRLGNSRKESLTSLRNRLDFDEIRSITGSLLQAEKMGMSLVNIIRVSSIEERHKRKQRAEEEALKIPVKILFPLALFIFPCMFIVILAPAIINFIQSMK